MDNAPLGGHGDQDGKLGGPQADRAERRIIRPGHGAGGHADLVTHTTLDDVSLCGHAGPFLSHLSCIYTT